MMIDSIKTPTHEEHLFSNLSANLLHGVEWRGGWLKLTKKNDPVSANDEAIYKPDFELTYNGHLLGIIDPEKKPRWIKNGFPHHKVNVARYPMRQWQSGQFNGRKTNKWLAFEANPKGSFFVAVRSDWRACVVVHWPDIQIHGKDEAQGNGYSSVAVPVRSIAVDLCQFCETPQEFTKAIISKIESAYA